MTGRHAEEEEDGEEHPPEGSDDGEDGFLGRREFADEELLLDLQPDEEEEDRHQGIVDDLTDGHRVAHVAEELNAADDDLDGVVEEVLVAGAPGGVRDGYGDDGRQEEQHRGVGAQGRETLS